MLVVSTKDLQWNMVAGVEWASHPQAVLMGPDATTLRVTIILRSVVLFHVAHLVISLTRISSGYHRQNLDHYGHDLTFYFSLNRVPC